MTVDVACVGSPFLDLIFRGLPAIPGPGEEQIAQELVIVPGAIANVAYALNRLGLDAVVCAPIGRDPAGRLLGELMADAGVRWVGRPAEATPVSVALPVHGDRAFVTAGPPPSVDVEALAELAPRAVVVDLPSADLLPPMPIVYAVVGDPEVAVLAGNLPGSLRTLRALILNDREARGMTVDVIDATGAGDLFTAAYVWSDLAGRSLEDRLALAGAYASLSLAATSNRQKGLTAEQFALALAARGQAHLWLEEA